MSKYVTYFRVSTAKQGASGLGIEAQKEAVARFLKPSDVIAGSFTETESGKLNARPQLAAALRLCRQRKAVLCIAKLDRLIRPLPRVVSVAHRVQLIGCAGDAAHSSLREDVALLTARGIDTRGVLLSGSALSPEAIRHGGAYLVELVATAQRGDRFQVNRGISHAQ